MVIQIRLSAASERDLKRIAKQLRTVGAPKAIRKELTAGLKTAAKPVERSVKAEAKSLPAFGTKSTGLRRRIANATSIAVRTSGKLAGVKIRIARSRLGDQAVLPQRMNVGSWRHPVYGNRNAWVTQISRAGWFDRTARRGAAQARREMQKVLDSIERKLSRK